LGKYLIWLKNSSNVIEQLRVSKAINSKIYFNKTVVTESPVRSVSKFEVYQHNTEIQTIDVENTQSRTIQHEHVQQLQNEQEIHGPVESQAHVRGHVANDLWLRVPEYYQHSELKARV
jgi:hypothetical protein